MILSLLLACGGTEPAPAYSQPTAPTIDRPTDTGEDSGDSAADSGDTAADSGDTAADSGDTAADTGDTGADSGDTGSEDARIGMLVSDFALVDLNAGSPRAGQVVSPRDYLEAVSGWYFIHST